jgi:hypothetical protein
MKVITKYYMVLPRSGTGYMTPVPDFFAMEKCVGENAEKC